MMLEEQGMADRNNAAEIYWEFTKRRSYECLHCLIKGYNASAHGEFKGRKAMRKIAAPASSSSSCPNSIV